MQLANVSLSSYAELRFVMTSAIAIEGSSMRFARVGKHGRSTRKRENEANDQRAHPAGRGSSIFMRDRRAKAGVRRPGGTDGRTDGRRAGRRDENKCICTSANRELSYFVTARKFNPAEFRGEWHRRRRRVIRRKLEWNGATRTVLRTARDTRFACDFPRVIDFCEELGERRQDERNERRHRSRFTNLR